MGLAGSTLSLGVLISAVLLAVVDLGRLIARLGGAALGRDGGRTRGRRDRPPLPTRRLASRREQRERKAAPRPCRSRRR